MAASSGAPLRRIDFSFNSYDDYVGEGDRHTSTGTLYLPLDRDGNVRTDASRLVMITEFPPGSSRSSFPLLAEYGELPPAVLGVPSAVVDIRGPVVSRLREFVNPDDPAGEPFSGEEQFAYSMLRSYAATGDETFLWEYQAAGAWLRAIRAVIRLVESEGGTRYDEVMLCGERFGAVSAAQAALSDARVTGVAMAGWPFDWVDYHRLRDRRWAWESRYEPMDDVQPTAYRDTREVLSFLRSGSRTPDPGCPDCAVGGREWLRQFDIATLRAAGHLPPALFLLEGDEDPSIPIDLLARTIVPPELLRLPLAVDASNPNTPDGPFAVPRPRPFDDLRVLRGGTSTLARKDAAEAVRAWAQSMNGFRQVPDITASEDVRDGELVVTVRVRERDARIVDVGVRTIETGARTRWNFKSPVHHDPSASLHWRDVPTRYAGHTIDRGGMWIARVPLSDAVHQAYAVSVRTRVGEVETEHSLPVRPLWKGRDPAGPR